MLGVLSRVLVDLVHVKIVWLWQNFLSMYNNILKLSPRSVRTWRMNSSSLGPKQWFILGYVIWPLRLQPSLKNIFWGIKNFDWGPTFTVAPWKRFWTLIIIIKWYFTLNYTLYIFWHLFLISGRRTLKFLCVDRWL